ncbi:YdiU family protein [Candidatus Methylopumilus universalis]|uniref:protein adenylyltransferase SelO n=1 Tax=Candidatus Methylopumilus universalis TaxID=2588536 RepID=UPI00111E483F|nr:YdiU family protein [Candidatus Methylopumilus universalis]QDC45523.1 YdiU family protein [Candidatus Methylopumilus universalis]
MHEINAQKPNKVAWQFNHSYTKLPMDFFVEQLPVKVSNPKLILLNEPLLKSLGLDKEALSREAWGNIFSGNELPEKAHPIAEAYAGHQFGHFAILGDGRAVLLGEHVSPDGDHFDIQFKGSGQTPYSRRGDGRAALGPMLREFIISEAMFALKIPTTRSLAVVTTGESVMRDEVLPGAILTRVAKSHIRVGTFQFASTLNDTNKLKALADYTIDRHYPECKAKDNPYLAFLNAVIERQALLLSQWMHVGFIHGVMNTDNMSISGETIDYGPCAFMDRYHPETVFSSIDRHGRYAYVNQPPIAQWNLARFAETLIPLIDHNTDKSIELASQSVNNFSDQFQRAWLRGMQQKLGLFNEGASNIELINELLVLMQKNRADYTLTFRHLSSDAILKDTIFKDASFKVWYKNWIHCIQKQKEGEETSKLMMLKHNPAVIPRNYLVEKALSLAVVDQDYHFLNDFIAALLMPYEESKVFGESPIEEDKSYQTFCGT